MPKKRKNKKRDKERAAKLHADQMRLLDISSNPLFSNQSKILALRQLKPKYFLKAVDETLELDLRPDSRLKFEYVKQEIKANRMTVKEAMDYLSGENDENPSC